MNPNPVAARLAQRRRRKAGDLQALTKALWQAIRDIERALETAVDHSELVSAAHALAACANAYSRLLQMGDYEARLAALEARVAKESHA
jgi:hypothetical protein